MTEPTPELLAGLEAILMVIDQPVTVEQLSDGLGIEPDEAAGALAHLAAEYDGEHDGRVRGFRLARAAGGWRIYSRPEHHDLVSAFLTAGQSARLSQAALETLAVIAYRQPVTRSRIAAVRGVNVDGVMRTLVARGLAVECGTDAETGGMLYRTTELFLERLGLASLDELPDIAPLLPDVDLVDEMSDDPADDPRIPVGRRRAATTAVARAAASQRTPRRPLDAASTTAGPAARWRRSAAGAAAARRGWPGTAGSPGWL